MSAKEGQPSIRTLGPGDEPALEAFLQGHLESSLFLLNNMRGAGLIDRGRRFEGTYAAAFERGEITGVVAHYWNQMLVFQAPVYLGELMWAAVEASGRPVGGLIGPLEQVVEAKRLLGPAETNLRQDSVEWLYSLELDRLIVPDALKAGQVRGRRVESDDVELLSSWGTAYEIEALGEKDSPALRQRILANAKEAVKAGRTWVLEASGEPVAISSFNAAIREAVQVGDVWTPPELRGRGYGRGVVAASLLDARAESVEMGVLFTEEHNIPAQKAYTALGFQRIGTYGLVLFWESVMVGGEPRPS